ncbi:hypothetical protein T4A_14000 [Trichinella pseudospiralis]|uniref:Uncharacterized protein n=1 Tax=Trichinella pseudospiralis TaxID=6337 RepID=A0A0V1DKZ4_TRIPS|nr:hypothetical protein T4A_14000 [Trichinella pseudospiralis]
MTTWRERQGKERRTREESKKGESLKRVRRGQAAPFIVGWAIRMPGAWDIVCVTDSHRIMELGALWCQAPVSGNVAHCSVPCRVFYWVSGASPIQPK